MHLADARGAPAYTPAITSALHQFLEKDLLSWLEVLSILGAVRAAADAMQVTTGWLEVCRIYVFDVLPNILKLDSGITDT